MKQVRLVAALLALFGVLALGWGTTTSLADVKQLDQCNCTWTSGARGVIRNNNCNVENCWYADTELQ